MNGKNQASQAGYDNTTHKTVCGERINYGILYGNEKIAFIKTGAGGSIKGYRDKYLKMAHRIHQKSGATVICSSNPDADSTCADKSLIDEVASTMNLTAFEVYFFGTSDGAYKNLILAKELPQAVKLIGVNTSLSGLQDLKNRLHDLPHIKKILVYGTEDDEYESVAALKELQGNNLEIKTVEGADHVFTGMLEEYIALTDLL